MKINMPVKLKKKDSITSKELVEIINYFRKEENRKSMLEHYDLIKAIRKEFKNDLQVGNISDLQETQKISTSNKGYINITVIRLTLKQALRMLTKESIFVRRKVFEYIEYLEQENERLRRELENRKNQQWLDIRKHGTLIRKNETDIIKKLAEYAERQGSRNSKMIYVVYTKLVNGTVGIGSGMRNSADIITLLKIAQLEAQVADLITKSIESEIQYKEIYQKCKILCQMYEKVWNMDLQKLIEN
jgi:hypothetical protein fuD12_10907